MAVDDDRRERSGDGGPTAAAGEPRSRGDRSGRVRHLPRPVGRAHRWRPHGPGRLHRLLHGLDDRRRRPRLGPLRPDGPGGGAARDPGRQDVRGRPQPVQQPAASRRAIRAAGLAATRRQLPGLGSSAARAPRMADVAPLDGRRRRLVKGRTARPAGGVARRVPAPDHIPPGRVLPGGLRRGDGGLRRPSVEPRRTGRGVAGARLDQAAGRRHARGDAAGGQTLAGDRGRGGRRVGPRRDRDGRPRSERSGPITWASSRATSRPSTSSASGPR